MAMRILYTCPVPSMAVVDVAFEVAFNVEFKVAFNVEFEVAVTFLTSAIPPHSSLPKATKATTGRNEKGELKTTSLTREQIVSQENHLNETSPVSLLNLYGLSPRQYMNM